MTSNMSSGKGASRQRLPTALHWIDGEWTDSPDHADSIDPATGKLAEGGAAAETQQLLKGLSAVLSAAGFSMGDVVKANVYLTDMGEFAAMNKVYESFFDAPYPARTIVAVAALPGGGHVEIELVAARPGA